MDTAHWPQDIGLLTTMEELPPPTPSAAPNNHAAAFLSGGGGGGRPQHQHQHQAPALMGGGERRARPQKEQELNCPRCNSTNTKFCYYNNYSLTQPRYFCKTCRRYWTEGGSLRNVPVGGGSRKNKRSTSSSNPPSSTATDTPASAACPNKTAMPEQRPKFHDGQDLNLEFQGRSLDDFVPMHPMTMPEYHHPPSGLGVQGFRQHSLSFPLDGLQESSTGMLLFPFEESRPVVSSSSGGDAGGDAAPGFWNGLSGGGGGSW